MQTSRLCIRSSSNWISLSLSLSLSLTPSPPLANEIDGSECLSKTCQSSKVNYQMLSITFPVRSFPKLPHEPLVHTDITWPLNMFSLGTSLHMRSFNLFWYGQARTFMMVMQLAGWWDICHFLNSLHFRSHWSSSPPQRLRDWETQPTWYQQLHWFKT